MINILFFSSVSFEPDTKVGRLCEELNTKIGYGLWFASFKIQNTKWLWFVNDIVTAMNDDKILCGVFGI
jgi:hypothetical protein